MNIKNKIFDCFMFHNETTLLEIRLNILNEYVDYFVIVESAETHSGLKKKLIFDINKYPNFRNKIIYSVIDKFPSNLSAWEKENYQRNFISNLLAKAEMNDFILISDLDEIPDLSKINLSNYDEKIIVFKQRLFLYKFNYGEMNPHWHGTRCSQKKNLKNPQWIRNLKTYKRYEFYRIDKIFFSENYERSFKIIDEGGWHFSWMGNIDFIKEKLNSFAHTELNISSLNNDDFIKKCIEKRIPIGEKQKINLEKLPLEKEFLPIYILNNKKKYKHLFDGEM